MDESELVYGLNIEDLVNRYEIPCRVELCVGIAGHGSKADEAIKRGFDWLFKMILKVRGDLQRRIDEDVQRQRAEENRIKKEKSARLSSSYNRNNNNNDDDDDEDPFAKKKSPWKSVNELKVCNV
jgi:hypothetical protein